MFGFFLFIFLFILVPFTMVLLTFNKRLRYKVLGYLVFRTPVIIKKSDSSIDFYLADKIDNKYYTDDYSNSFILEEDGTGKCVGSFTSSSVTWHKL